MINIERKERTRSCVNICKVHSCRLSKAMGEHYLPHPVDNLKTPRDHGTGREEDATFCPLYQRGCWDGP
jgi:hypothetical protein